MSEKSFYYRTITNDEGEEVVERIGPLPSFGNWPQRYEARGLTLSPSGNVAVEVSEVEQLRQRVTELESEMETGETEDIDLSKLSRAELDEILTENAYEPKDYANITAAIEAIQAMPDLDVRVRELADQVRALTNENAELKKQLEAKSGEGPAATS